jgi:hypothetical protein
MLQVELDLDRIAQQQDSYTARNLHGSRDLVFQVIAFRKALEHDARRFNRRQAQNAESGNPLLGDGRMATLHKFVVRGTGDTHWPRRAAAMLRGLHTRDFIQLPMLVPKNEQPRGAWEPSESWVARLDDAPHDARDFPNLTAIAAYFDPLTTIRILWIGAEGDFLQALRHLARETQGWFDWSAVYPPYHATASRGAEP